MRYDRSMKKKLIGILGIFLVPKIARAGGGLQDFISGFAGFLNSTLVPLLFALAFLFFLINATRHFIIGGDKEDARKKAKSLARWGIIAFVLMVSIWGIVNLLVNGFGIDNSGPICPDFLTGTSGPGSNCLTPPIT